MNTLRALLLLSIAGSTTAAADLPLPVNKIQPPEVGPIEPVQVKPGEKPTQGTDLDLTALRFLGDGRISYIVRNVGQVGATSPYVVDLEVAGKRADTIKHPPLPARSQQRVISNLAAAPTCSLTNLRALADTQRLVAESDEANNIAMRDVVPPCPDLVASIEKDSLNNHLEYQGKGVVTNRGTMKTRREFTLRFYGQCGLGGTPWIKEPKVPLLAPGESFKVKEEDKHWGTTSCGYHIVADRFGDIPESDETNNVTNRSLP